MGLHMVGFARGGNPSPGMAIGETDGARPSGFKVRGGNYLIVYDG